MLKMWHRWAKSMVALDGLLALDVVERRASRSLRRERRRIDSSAEGSRVVFEERADGGEGVGGFRAGSSDGLEPRDSEANAESRSLECEVQNCMYRATILL